MLEILRSAVGPTEVQPGCISCRLCTEESPDRAVVLHEQWQTEEALAEHIRSAAFRRILAALDLAARTPEVSFHHVSETEGMELVQRLSKPLARMTAL